MITDYYLKSAKRLGSLCASAVTIQEIKTMAKNVLFFCAVLAMASFFTGCGSHEPRYTGKEYPPTDKVETVFQKNQVPESCRVFAHLFVTMPARYTGSEFVEAVSAEAKAKGADMMLIGQARQCTTESSLAFTYYGPDREYRIRDWPGWGFGFEDWEEQGDWASIGYEEWGAGTVHYDYPIIMQVVFLRCQ